MKWKWQIKILLNARILYRMNILFANNEIEQGKWTSMKHNSVRQSGIYQFQRGKQFIIVEMESIISISARAMYKSLFKGKNGRFVDCFQFHFPFHFRIHFGASLLFSFEFAIWFVLVGTRPSID